MYLSFVITQIVYTVVIVKLSKSLASKESGSGEIFFLANCLLLDGHFINPRLIGLSIA
jgi:hypothetical protein